MFFSQRCTDSLQPESSKRWRPKLQLLQETLAAAGAREMVERTEHFIFHHILELERLLLLKKQVLAGNRPRARTLNRHKIFYSFITWRSKKNQRLRMLSSTLSYWPPGDDHFPSNVYWSTRLSRDTDEHAHLNVRARGFWNASQGCSLVPRPIIVSMDNQGLWCGTWWECLYPLSSSPANTLHKRQAGLLHHSGHLLPASVAINHRYPVDVKEEVWTTVWRDPCWR